MRLCKHCNVRVELIECADGVDRWMHKITGIACPVIYLECHLPRTVAEPMGSGSDQ